MLAIESRRYSRHFVVRWANCWWAKRSWRPAEQRDLPTVGRLTRLAFLLGGPVHVAGLRSGELPRPLSLASLAVAPLGILAPLSLAAERAMPIIPLGRFSALIIIGIAGVGLSRRLH